MTSDDTTPGGLPYHFSADGDPEMAALIASWRYQGPRVGWEAVVGHGPQIERLREVVEKTRRPPQELEALHLRLGAGLVISGPPGVGKTLLARALASALERDVIAPPTAELGAETIRRMYAQLRHEGIPVIVILDEVELLIGQRWQRRTDEAVLEAMLNALDGIDRPARGPITVGLTTELIDGLDPAAIRPGRLAPRLVLQAPTAGERRVLLERLIDGLPVEGAVDLKMVVDRTEGWTGAELAGAIEEACTRSLLDHTDALRQDLLLGVVAERYVVIDEADPDEGRWTLERIAIHEAGHVLYAWLTWPEGVASVQLNQRGGETTLAPAVLRRSHDARELHSLAEFALAGSVAEAVVLGESWVTSGGHSDTEYATRLLLEAVAIAKPYAIDPFEAGSMSDRGSERMRAGWHAEVEAAANGARANAYRRLGPHPRTLRGLADLLLEAPDNSLSGDELEEAINHALGAPAAERLRNVSDSEKTQR